MMNTREKFENMLVERGFFPSQATEVMTMAIPEIDSVVPDYKFTWDRPADEYPEPIYNVVFAMTVRQKALQYINEKCPLAWFKPLFE